MVFNLPEDPSTDSATVLELLKEMPYDTSNVVISKVRVLVKFKLILPGLLSSLSNQFLISNGFYKIEKCPAESLVHRIKPLDNNNIINHLRISCT